ncbi:hypothetical protein [Bradyrhizobium sp. LMTR 3]|uniref:hypothetical protein n=1 Tax=Bradyrhizobium sp. LMTR 3 TaxID=189873 RepID=UPI0008109918|nr:hypothetical protein [Bradyrhizobium sp. LMTR 3]OCK60572.1 hypothetical protein LMTR3_15665 [Bradyrhizobium sp. LMTR 3]
MKNYRVSFYKYLCNSDGHSFKCLQRQVDVQSDGSSQALVLAERLVDNERLDADCVEVMHLASHHEFEHSAGHSPVPADTHGIAPRNEMTST